MDSNHRRQSRQIYSLIPLATREPLRRFLRCVSQRQKTCAILRARPYLGKRFHQFFCDLFHKRLIYQFQPSPKFTSVLFPNYFTPRAAGGAAQHAAPPPAPNLCASLPRFGRPTSRHRVSMGEEVTPVTKLQMRRPRPTLTGPAQGNVSAPAPIQGNRAQYHTLRATFRYRKGLEGS